MSNMKIVLAVLATVLVMTGCDVDVHNNRTDPGLEMRVAIARYFIDNTDLSSDQAAFVASSCLDYRTYEYEIDAEKHEFKYVSCKSDYYEPTLTFVLSGSNEVIGLRISESFRENQAI